MNNWAAVGVAAASAALVVWMVSRASLSGSVRRLGLRRLGTAKTETFAAAGAVGLAVSLLFAALVIGESLRASLADLERTRLGPIDVVITLRGPAAREGAREIREALSGRPGVTATVVRGVQVTAVSPAEWPEEAGDEGGVSAEPRTVAYDFGYGELRAFAQGIPYGMPESGPGSGKVFVARDLARLLEVKEGDRIGVVIGERRDGFGVEKILQPEGVSGYTLDIEKPVLSVFLPQGYLDDIPAVTEVLVNVGTPRGSGAADVLPRAEREIASLQPVFEALEARGTRPVVRYARADLLEASSRIGSSQASQMIQLGALSFLAALGLLATVLYLLLSTRRQLAGIVRAVGMRRRDVSASNDLSALAVAVPGIVGGLALGAVVAWIAVELAGRAVGHQLGSFETVLSVPFWVVGLTGGTGVLITGIFSRASSAVLLSSYPAELISGRERPLRFPGIAALAGGLAVGVFGVAATAIDIRAKNPTFTFLGPPMAAAGLVLLSLPTRFRRVMGGLSGAFTVAWIAYVEGKHGVALQPPEFGALPMVVAAALLAGAVAALVALLGPAEWLARTLLDTCGRRAVGLRTALRSLKVRRGATWFVVQASAAAVSVLAMVGGVFVLEGVDFDRLERGQLGGWSGAVEVRRSGVGDPAAAVKGVLAEADVDPSADTVSLESTQKFLRVVAGGRGLTRVYELPRGIVSGGDFIPLTGRNARFSSDAEAWAALFDEDPPEGRRWVIMSEGAVDLGLVAPASAVLVDPESQKSYGLAGVAAKNDIIPGVYAAPGVVEAGSYSLAPKTVLVKIRGRIDDPARLAAEMQGRLLEYGALVTFSSQVVEERLRVRRLVSLMLRVFLTLGLVVAVAAQAAVVSRAVRARIRSLAVLRAIGATRGGIFRSVSLEGLSMAALGSVAGCAVGSAVAWRLYGRVGGEVSILELAATAALLTVLSTVTVGLASLIPARAAARVYPAEVLRNPEE